MMKTQLFQQTIPESCRLMNDDSKALANTQLQTTMNVIPKEQAATPHTHTIVHRENRQKSVPSLVAYFTYVYVTTLLTILCLMHCKYTQTTHKCYNSTQTTTLFYIHGNFTIFWYISFLPIMSYFLYFAQSEKSLLLLYTFKFNAPNLVISLALCA